jgi:hypothetical protein
MSRQALQESLAAGGRHHALQRLAGEWEGTARVWFEPGKLGDEAPIRGSIRVVLGGRFVVHEYATTFMGTPNEGIAIIGWHIDAGRYEMAWVDAGHNGSAIMFSEGGHAAAGIAVLGSYFATDGSAAWGWRTTIETPADDRLLITAWNVSPDGDEARATEIEYRRRGGSGNGSVG